MQALLQVPALIYGIQSIESKNTFVSIDISQMQITQTWQCIP